MNRIVFSALIITMLVACKTDDKSVFMPKQYTIQEFYKNKNVIGGAFSPSGDKLLVSSNETGIYNALNGDLYLALGDPLKDGAFTVRFYFNPFVRLIWLGCLVMAIGGIVSLSDRRLRIGAPKRAKKQKAAVPAE